MSRFHFINNKTVQMLNNSVNFKDTKKVDHILESSLEFQSYFYECFVIYQLSEIKDDSQVVSHFLCLFGLPVVRNQYNKIAALHFFRLNSTLYNVLHSVEVGLG